MTASNINVTPSTAANKVSVKTDFIEGEHVPQYKSGFGKDGEHISVSEDNPLPVTLVAIQELTDIMKESVINQKILIKYLAMGFDETITEEDIK